MQTSIEWFIEHLLGNGLLRLTKEEHKLYSELRDKAKEMHKDGLESLYTKEDVLKAGEIGEINHFDYKHIVSLLDEAKAINKSLKQPKKD
jgi:hypothetical protein